LVAPEYVLDLPPKKELIVLTHEFNEFNEKTRDQYQDYVKKSNKLYTERKDIFMESIPYSIDVGSYNVPAFIQIQRFIETINEIHGLYEDLEKKKKIIFTVG
jgi:hypothetical protein